MDLKYLQEAPGGYYYRDHLPILGQTVEAHQTKYPQVQHPQFNVGDKVKVLLDVETLKVMQEGHGGWNPRMAEVRSSEVFIFLQQFLISKLLN